MNPTRSDIRARVAFGLKARTGRAMLVALGGDVSEPHVVERLQMQLLPDGAVAPYHAAAALDSSEACASIQRDIECAQRLAKDGLRDAARRVTAAGYDVHGCAVLVGTGMPNWSTDEILSVHVRMHQAEGEMFRDALVAGARACDLTLTTLPEKTALDAAAKMLQLPRAVLDAKLVALGTLAGSPWGKDQKEAAAAALVSLGR